MVTLSEVKEMLKSSILSGSVSVIVARTWSPSLTKSSIPEVRFSKYTEVIVGIGSDVFLEKDIDEVIEDFKKSTDELTNAETMINEQIEKITKFMDKMQKDLEKKIKLMESQQTPATTQ